MYENDGGLLSPRDAYRLMLKDYPDVMDIGQMCEALGVSTKTGYKLLKDGKIEYLTLIASCHTKNSIPSYRPEFLYFGLIFLQQEDRSHGHPKHKPSASLP